MLKGNVFSSLCVVASLTAAVLSVPACVGSNATPDGGTATDAGGATDGGRDDGSVVVNTCTAPTGGPTMHAGDVTGAETWTAAGSPHLVTEDVNVRAGAQLTIEPCAEVRFAAGTSLRIAYPITPSTGSLIAEGAADKPIRFVGNDGARWGNLYVIAPGTARLRYVTLEGGGADTKFSDGATIYAAGDDQPGDDANLFVDHVTVAKSAGAGVWLTRGAAFAAGSQDLVIRASGSTEHPYPLEIEEPAIDALPTGAYTGNAKDEILLDPRGGKVAGSGLLTDATLHERGVPYHVGRSSVQSFVVGGGPEGSLATLTIEAGVTLRFEPQTALKVQSFTTDKPSTGALKALGTAEKPVVFTSAAPSPNAGDWRGIWYGGVPQASNSLDHARIEYAGYDCGCILVTCSNISQYEGAVIFSQPPPSAFITNTVFSNIAGHAVTEGFDGTLVNFRPTNTFDAVSGCAQTLPRKVGGSCDKPLPACD